MNKNTRLFYFDNFRAIAILFIVWGHCYSGWENTSYFEIFISNAITGGTALFVFISGFFLHHVFYTRKVGYASFLTKKFISVGVPYFVLSSLFMVLYFIVKGDLQISKYLEGFSTLEIMLINFATGRTLVAYWYIPFVLTLFFLTPVYYSFIRASFKFQIFLTLFLMFSSAVFGRPIGMLNPLHAVLYFTPFYLFGIIFSLNQSKIIPIIQKYKFLLLAFWILSLASMNYFEQIGNLHKLNPFSFEGFDLMILQKITLIFLLLAVCYTFLNSEIKVLNFIANNSFPVFFIHGWVLAFIKFIFYPKLVSFIEVSAYFLFVISISLLLSLSVKRIFKDKSKYLIGS